MDTIVTIKIVSDESQCHATRDQIYDILRDAVSAVLCQITASSCLIDITLRVKTK